MNKAWRASRSIASIFSARKKKKPKFDPFKSEIPSIVESCVTFIEQYALHVEGIFRLSGEFKRIESIIKSFEQGNTIRWNPSDDPHLVAGVLKCWLCQLESPLLTNELHDSFISAQSSRLVEDRLKRMAAVICLLPPGNLLIFERLIGMAVKIAENYKKNKMEATNLSIVFAPALLRYECSDLTKLLSHSEAANNVILLAIIHYNELFSNRSQYVNPSQIQQRIMSQRFPKDIKKSLGKNQGEMLARKKVAEELAVDSKDDKPGKAKDVVENRNHSGWRRVYVNKDKFVDTIAEKEKEQEEERKKQKEEEEMLKRENERIVKSLVELESFSGINALSEENQTSLSTLLFDDFQVDELNLDAIPEIERKESVCLFEELTVDLQTGNRSTFINPKTSSSFDKDKDLNDEELRFEEDNLRALEEAEHLLQQGTLLNREQEELKQKEIEEEKKKQEEKERLEKLNREKEIMLEKQRLEEQEQRIKEERMKFEEEKRKEEEEEKLKEKVIEEEGEGGRMEEEDGEYLRKLKEIEEQQRIEMEIAQKLAKEEEERKKQKEKEEMERQQKEKEREMEQKLKSIQEKLENQRKIKEEEERKRKEEEEEKLKEKVIEKEEKTKEINTEKEIVQHIDVIHVIEDSSRVSKVEDLEPEIPDDATEIINRRREEERLRKIKEAEEEERRIKMNEHKARLLLKKAQEENRIQQLIEERKQKLLLQKQELDEKKRIAKEKAEQQRKAEQALKEEAERLRQKEEEELIQQLAKAEEKLRMRKEHHDSKPMKQSSSSSSKSLKKRPPLKIPDTASKPEESRTNINITQEKKEEPITNSKLPSRQNSRTRVSELDNAINLSPLRMSAKDRRKLRRTNDNSTPDPMNVLAELPVPTPSPPLSKSTSALVDEPKKVTSCHSVPIEIDGLNTQFQQQKQREISSQRRNEQSEVEIRYTDGSKYIGGAKNGIWEGKGRVTFANGDIYEGEVSNNCMNGVGEFKYAVGDVYSGQWVNDIREGCGRYVAANGDIYVGEFHNDERSGKGVYTMVTGDRYEGDFKNGVPNGKGVFIFTSGDLYEGDFVDDVFHGKGKLSYHNNSCYTGDFYKGVKHGQGTFKLANGDIYTGGFKNGRFHGKGVYSFVGGGEINGFFDNGRPLE